MPRFRVLKTDRSSFYVRLRPGGNDSVWDCDLFPLQPHGYAYDDIEKELRRWDGWNGDKSDAAERKDEVRLEVSASSIIDRIKALEARAAGHRKRLDDIDALDKRLTALLQEQEDVEKAIQIAKEELVADYEGQNAIAALEQLNKLVK